MKIRDIIVTVRIELLASEVARAAPHLADVPERTARFTAAVQRMLLAGSDAEQAAKEVAREVRSILEQAAPSARPRAAAAPEQAAYGAYEMPIQIQTGVHPVRQAHAVHRGTVGPSEQ